MVWYKCQRCNQEMSKVHTYSHFLMCNPFEWTECYDEHGEHIRMYKMNFNTDDRPSNNPIYYTYKEQFVKIESVEEPTWKSRLPEPDKRCMREIE